MSRIDLPSPVPRAVPESWSPFQLATVSKRYLPIPSNSTPIDPTFFSTLSSRQTRRNLGELTFDDLSQLLWHSFKVNRALPPSSAVRWQHRPVASAGGLHCIGVLIVSDAAVDVYDPVGHALEALQVEREALQGLLREMDSMIEVGHATLLWFAADYDLMNSKYEHSESLVWRDAGALLATICLVAEALKLGCCPIGITGEPYISAMLNSSGRVAGVGGILVGTRLSSLGSQEN